MSSNPEDAWLIALAAAVSDGRDVDWPATEQRAATPEQRRIVAELRGVSTIVQANRSSGTSADVCTAEPPPAAPAQWKHLLLFECVGSGAFGSVYRGWDSLLDREVAVKIRAKPRPLGGAALDEARNLARVRHSNIVVVHGADEDDQQTVIWMEYIDGHTLAEIVRERGPMSAREVAGIGLDLCSALSAIHAAGLLHRDVKAHNVMREVGGRIVLMDFSGAHALRGDSAATALSGTPLYMAPELLAGVEATPASDVYSLGVLLFFLVAGLLPIRGQTIQDVKQAHANGERKRLRDVRPDLPDRLVQVIERAIAPDQTQRFATAGELEHALATASGAHAIVSPAALGPRAHDSGTRFRGWAAVATLVALVVLAVLFVRSTQRPDTPPPPSVRFTVGPPYVAGSWPRISPDGRIVVFGAILEGRNRFWLRRLDETEGRPLMETTANETPFWSPDSRTLCFFTDGKLYAIDVAVGAPRVLADAPFPHGGDWSGDSILYSRRDGIYRVDPAGGTPQQLTAVDEAQGEFQHGWPEFLPDGRRFLYIVGSSRPDRSGVYVGSTDGRAPWRLGPAYSRVAYADGRMLYVRDGTLMAQPFDARSAALDGDPVPVAHHVKYHPANDAAFDVAANGVLIYMRRSGQPSTRLVLYDRRGREIQPLTEIGTFRHPRFSPDSRRIVVERSDTDDANMDLWVYDVQGQGAIRLTRSPAQDVTPAWSPDGRRVAFSSRRGPVFDVFQKTVDGVGEERSLLTVPGDTFVEHWSPDGRYMTGTVLRSGLWLLPLDDRQGPRLIRSGEGAETWHSEFAPNGRWLAYMSSESGRSEVYVEPFPATGARWQVSARGGAEPHWSDAGELVYVDPDGMLHSVRQTTGGWRDSEPQPLFRISIPDLGGRLDYALSPDRRFVVVNTFIADPVVPPVDVVVNWAALLVE